jgi:hypothetical protein
MASCTSSEAPYNAVPIMFSRPLIIWCAYTCLGLHTYLFVRRLFTHAFKGSDYTQGSEGRISKETIRNDMEAICFGLT